MALTPRRKNHDGLLLKQKNQLFEVVDRRVFNHAEFEWKVVASNSDDGKTVDALVHSTTDYFFLFDSFDQYYTTGAVDKVRVCVYSPGTDRIEVGVQVSTWDSVILEFDTWLRNLKSEIDAPNLWEEFLRGDLGNAWKVSNKKFTDSERKAVQAQLNNVRELLVINAGNDSDKLKDINGKLDYLALETKKQGRRDWLLMFMGVIVSKATEWNLDTNQIKQIIAIIVRATQNLLGAG